MELHLDPNTLHSFISISSDLMAVLSEEGRFLEASPAWATTLGYSLSELRSTPFFELLHFEDLSKTQIEIQKLLKEPRTALLENRLRHKDQSVLWFRWKCFYSREEGQFYLSGQDITELKRSQETLKENRDLFLRMTESATEGIAIHENAVILETNQAMARILGYEKAEDLIGKNGLDFAAPEFRPLIINNIQTGNEEPYEIVGLRRDGTRFNCLLSGKPVIFQGRKVRISTFLDITKMKKREQELFESQELFRKLSEAAKDGIVVSEMGVILLANPAFAHMFGFEVSEMIGRNALEFTAEEFRKNLLNKLSQEVETSYEIMGLRKNGSRFPIEITARMTSYQGRRVRVSYFRDITQRKKIEDEVLHQKQFSENLINSSTDGLLAFNPECLITLWNPSMERISGHSREEVLGQCAFDVFPFLKQTGEDLYFYNALAGKTCFAPERSYRTSHGKAVFFEAHYMPLKNRPGQIIGGLAVIREITERKKTEESLRQSELNLKAVFQNTFQSIILLDPEGKVLAFNNNAAADVMENSGKKLEIGRSMGELVQLEDPEFLSLNFARALKGEASSFERTFQMKNGEFHWFETNFNPVFGEKGEIEGVCLTALNIDHRKKVEEALQSSEGDLRAIFDSSQQIIILIGKNGLIRAFNQSAKKILKEIMGFNLEIGRSLVKYIEPDFVKPFQERLKKVLRGEVIHFDRMVLTRNGRKEWFEFTYNPVMDPKGKVIGACVVISSIDEQIRAQESLKESEEKFRKVFAQASIGMTLVDSHFHFSHVNKTFCDFVGYSSEELIGKTFVDITHPDDLSKIGQHKKDVSSGKGFRTQKRFLHKNGSTLWADLTVTSFLNDEGELLYSLGMIEDITLRKVAEDSLRESQERFERLAQVTQEGILLHESPTIVDVNTTLSRMLGYSIPEMIGKSGFDFLDPSSHQTAREHMIKGSPDPYEALALRKDGSVFPIELQGLNYSYKGKDLRVLSVRDMTWRKNTERILRESEEGYRGLVEYSPEAILVHDGDKLLYANPSGIRIFGVQNPEEVLGKSIWKFIHPEFHEVARKRVLSILQDQVASKTMEQKWLSMDGRLIDLEVKGIPFTFRGQPAIMAILRDITESKKNQQTLLRYERLAAVGQVITAIAHDIRNPLAILSGTSQILSSKLESREEYSQELKTIQIQAEHLKYFMNDILDYSREMEIRKSKMDPIQLLEQSLLAAQTQVGSKKDTIQVEKHYSLSLPKLHADNERMRQVLVNLILNAYDALEKGGRLLLSAEGIHEKMFLSVEDNGHGVSEVELNQLFEPFFTTKKNGSGLGLSISQKIVEAHGGKIKVERLKPQGLKFVVELPLA